MIDTQSVRSRAVFVVVGREREEGRDSEEMAKLGDRVTIAFGKRKGKMGTLVGPGRSRGRWKVRLVGGGGTTIEYPESKLKIMTNDDWSNVAKKKTKKAPPPPPGKGSKPPKLPSDKTKPKITRPRKLSKRTSPPPAEVEDGDGRTKELEERERRLAAKKSRRLQQDMEEEMRRERERMMDEIKEERERFERKMKAEADAHRRKLEREAKQRRRKLEEEERELRLEIEEERERNEDKLREMEKTSKDAKRELERTKRRMEREMKDIEDERRRLKEEERRLEEDAMRQTGEDTQSANEVKRLANALEEARKDVERQREIAERERQAREALEDDSKESKSESDDVVRRMQKEMHELKVELEEKRAMLKSAGAKTVAMRRVRETRRRKAESIKMVPIRAEALEKFDGLVSIMNNLHEASSRLGDDAELLDISLPRIAVIGGQSAGKSSVLEALVGRGFLPRGSGICTRRPLLLQMVCDPKCGRDYAQFSHLGSEKIYDFERVQQEIIRETDRVTGGRGSKTISNKPILLKVTAKDVLNLTLVDLPGMTRVPVRGQPEDMPEQLRAMCSEFIQDKNTIILAVTAANQDLAVSDAIQLAKKYDPTGERTLGVLTKLDLMDAGTDALDILSGRGALPLKLGYIGVVNRSQLDLNRKVPIDIQRKNELSFFENHRAYRRVASKSGTGYLAKVLNRMLLGEVEKQLPALKRQIGAFIKKYKSDLEEVDELPEDVREQRRIVTRILQQYASNVKNSIRYRARNTQGDRQDHVYITAPQQGAVLREEIDLYCANLASVNISDLASQKELSKVVGNTVGTGLFSPNDAFYALIKRGMERMREPSHDLVEKAHSKLLRMIKNEAPTNEMGRFANLGVRIIRTTTDILESYIQETKVAVDDFVDMELSLINTEHPDFAGSRSKLGHIIAKISSEVMEESQAKRRRMMIDIDENDSDENDASYASLSPARGQQARITAVEDIVDGGDDDDDGDAPPPLPMRTRRGAPPTPPTTSTNERAVPPASLEDKILFSGILERKSHGMFSSSWKQQWVQLTGDRKLSYWDTKEIPEDGEPPYRVLNLSGAKLELGDGYRLKNKDFPNNPEYNFRCVSDGAAGTYKIVAPFGVGWRKSPDYDDRYEDGVRGPDAGATIMASKAKDVNDRQSGETITFVYVNDKDAPGDHGGWLPNVTRTGEKILARQVQDVEKVLVMMCSDKKYSAWLKEEKRKRDAAMRERKRSRREKASSTEDQSMKSPSRSRRRRQVRSLFEVEEIEKRMLRTLILSYYGVIQKKITDSVPKIVAMCMISKLSECLEKELYGSILSLPLKSLLGDDDKFTDQRIRIKRSIKMLEKVQDAISTLQMAGAVVRS